MINVPMWWRSLPRLEKSKDILALRDQVLRADVSLNDRINVEKIWLDMLLHRFENRKPEL